MKLEQAKVVKVVIIEEVEWVLVERSDKTREWWTADYLEEYNAR